MRTSVLALVVVFASPGFADEGNTVVEQEETFKDVPDGQKGDQAGKAVGRMKQILGKVLKYLSEAREERDVIKLNCVNAKLTAVKGLLRVSEAAYVVLLEKVARADTDAATHHFRKISRASRKTEQLLADSEACVGQLAVYSGDTKVEVTIEEEVTVDTSKAPTPPPIVVEQVNASGFQ